MHRLRPAADHLRALARRAFLRALRALVAGALGLAGPHVWAAAQPAPSAAPTQAAQAQAPQQFYIREYRVLGAHYLKPIEIEAAVYPFLGPGRTVQDIEGARAALVKAYQDKQYTSVNVVVPPQRGAGGIVFLQVDELTVGRLRVHGSRYYDINQIKRQVPSLAEGKLVDFAQAQKDLVGLSQLPDRRITPVIQAGVLPNTMDVDLNVKDTLPLHGSVELNNRYSADTPSLRLNSSLSYDNLWQLGHSAGGSVQVSPQDVGKVQVFTGFYTVRFPTVDWLSYTLQGTLQNTNVSTLGALDVVGKGKILGLQTNFKLPTMGDYFHSFTFGVNYKAYDQTVNTINLVNNVSLSGTDHPTTYVPVTLDYTGTWVGKKFISDLDLQVVFNIRGIGSTAKEFDANRYNAEGNFIYLRGDFSHTQDLPLDMQVFAKVAGQVSDSPLIDSEEFSAGGIDTVRGYLESAVLGDNAAVFNFEYRSPSLLGWIPHMDKTKPSDEWRFYFFTDAAAVGVRDPLPEQIERYSLASYGAGTRMTLFAHFNGSLDVAIPLFTQANTKIHNPFLTFRLWTDF